MANTITGKFIAVSNVETIKTEKGEYKKRKLLIDCTRYDPYTGKRGYENTPLLEFGGKTLEKLEALLNEGLKKDDIVTVSFDIQGTKYTSKTTKKQDVFTSIRPYDIEVKKESAPTTPPPPAPAPPPPPADDNELPF